MAAGTIPDFLATRRASLPTSKTFFLRFFIALRRLAQAARRRKSVAFVRTKHGVLVSPFPRGIWKLSEIEQELKVDAPIRGCGRKRATSERIGLTEQGRTQVSNRA